MPASHGGKTPECSASRKYEQPFMSIMLASEVVREELNDSSSEFASILKTRKCVLDY